MSTTKDKDATQGADDALEPTAAPAAANAKKKDDKEGPVIPKGGIYPGSVGEAVKAMQEFLDLPTTGYYSPDQRKVVDEHRRRFGLPANGVFDRALAERIYEDRKGR